MRCPVVYFGSEGEFNLSAHTLEGFLRLATLGVPIDELERMSPETRSALAEQPPSPRLAAFRDWLQNTTGLEPCSNLEPLLHEIAEARGDFLRSQSVEEVAEGQFVWTGPCNE